VDPVDRSVPGRVGFAAGSPEAKGVDTVLAAMPAVRAARPGAHLWVAGGGDGPPASELEAAGAVWHGRVERDELLGQWLPTCRVFAYPSHFDGLPLILLESLAIGVPVVVSDYFALPEVAGDSAGTRVVPEDDAAALAAALIDLLDDDRHAEASTAARARYAEAYDPAVVLPRLRHEYDRAVADGRRRIAGSHRTV
jgi:glycosyltransferase involved in cell wall biosynthesis